MKNQTQTFNVAYTKKIGGNGSILVKSTSKEGAIEAAKYLCFTGSNFRDAKETNEQYIKPFKQGFAGSHRQ